MKITLKDGAVLELQDGKNALDAAKDISQGLYKAALACKINGEVKSLPTELHDGDTLEILTWEDEQGKRALRHTASHVLAQAVLRLYPEVKLAIGPAVENGFYYDFDRETPFSAEELGKIESEMKKIVKENHRIERYELPRAEALQHVADQPYKVELISELPEGEIISFYKHGEFSDLCAGPHLPSTGGVKAYKLTSTTGAYWRGDSNRKMLWRIYGTAFTKKEDMEQYLAAVEEAKKRDHNKVGRELSFFTTSELIGQGLPVLLPKGAKVLQILQRWVEDEEERRGWQLTKTPFMAKSDLYKISGHWDHYRDGMFVMGDPEGDQEVYALRPMTCPFQYQAYLHRSRSYRDLPIRYNETSTLFRNESSGEMHGLIRLRQFTISEGHLICRPDQLKEEFRGCLELSIYMLKTLGLYEDVSYRFSQWDPNNSEKYIGTPEQWQEAQSAMYDILDELQVPYVVGIDEAAFYGPKLDIQIKNVHGKEDTLITVQIDQMLAEVFGMEYIDSDGKKKNPYIIHRTSVGCYERTLALLIEKYAGALPLWLSPEQVRILPITDRNHEYSINLQKRLQAAGIRCECDARSEKTGYKIREAQMQKVPYMLVIGDKEQEENTVAVRSRKTGETENMGIDEFMAMVIKENAERTI